MPRLVRTKSNPATAADSQGPGVALRKTQKIKCVLLDESCSLNLTIPSDHFDTKLLEQLEPIPNVPTLPRVEWIHPNDLLHCLQEYPLPRAMPLDSEWNCFLLQPSPHISQLNIMVAVPLCACHPTLPSMISPNTGVDHRRSRNFKLHIKSEKSAYLPDFVAAQKLLPCSS